MKPQRLKLGEKLLLMLLLVVIAVLVLVCVHDVPSTDEAWWESYGKGFASNGDQKAKFLQRYGDHYGYGGRIDSLYAREIGPRHGAHEHYLDYTGAALYWNSQVAAAAQELQQSLFGNPHCASPSSLRTDKLVEGTRAAVLQFFGADPREYALIFTRSGTGALKMLGEVFPWTPQSKFVFLDSNHNSVLGIREYARQHGASFNSLTETDVEAWLADADASTLRGLMFDESSVLGAASTLKRDAAAAAAGGGDRELGIGGNQLQQQRRRLQLEDQPAYCLFAYPAYDNYAGVMYPLSWVKRVQARSTDTHAWKVLLDVAAFVPSHKLNLTETPADFVDLSFYKMFGYPTGIGALIVRKENLPLLQQTYWGGGGVFTATAKLDWHHFKLGHAAFEHGTLPFLTIIALRHGLKMYEQLGGIEAIERHVSVVGEYLYDQLDALKHSNGNPVVRVFGKHHLPNRRQVQGATLNFQMLGPLGEVRSYKQAARLLAEAGIHIRSGCTCNPGACYNSTGVREEEVRQLADAKHDNFAGWEWINVNRGEQEQLPLGSIRVSLGAMSRFEDAQALVDFIRITYTDSDP